MSKLDFVVNSVQTEKKKKRIAVAAAHDEVVLRAVVEAYNKGIVVPLLIGDREKIQEISENIGLSVENCEVIHCQEKECAVRAVELVSQGHADLLMKGAVKTGDLMSVVLQKEYGLRIGNTLTMVSVFDISSYERLLIASDGAMIIAPTLEQKVDIINACVHVARRLGIQQPKVAVLGALEIANPKMPVTLEAAILSKMNQRNQIKNCVVDGPLALDNAVSVEAARHKGIESPVAGKADILIMPDIEAGNIFYKAMVFLGGAKVASTIVGARVPVVLTSRADSDETKFYSIALGAFLAEG